MVELSPQTEKLMLIILPMVVEWAKTGKKLSIAEVEAFKNIFPDLFEYAKKADFQDVMEFNAKYRDHEVYGEYLKYFLTPEGKLALEYFLRLAREFDDR